VCQADQSHPRHAQKLSLSIVTFRLLKSPSTGKTGLRWPSPATRAARPPRKRCSGRLAVRRAAIRYADRAAAWSPAISGRCARTASRRWHPASRPSASSASSSASPARALHHREGHDAVERYHRAVRGALQQDVQGEYLRPVCPLCAFCPVMNRRDRRLDLVRAKRFRSWAARWCSWRGRWVSPPAGCSPLWSPDP
jgi:hypothetical protein